MQKMREIREAKNLTQQEVAEIAGVHNSLISRLENGETAGSVKTLRKIAAALGVTVGELLEDGPDNKPAA